MTTKIRVRFTHVPQLVRDVLTHAISGQPDMELVTESSADTLSGPADSEPDVVIVGAEDREDLQAVTSVLWHWPRTQVLMVTIDGRQSALYRLEPQRTDLGELSPDEIVERIRSAVTTAADKRAVEHPGRREKRL